MDATSIDKRIFIIAVTAGVLVPRLPFDDPISIGGHLSRGFRSLLLVTVILNLLQWLVMRLLRDTFGNSFIYFLYAIEATMLSFLSLLTPYVLRVWLADRINFSGARQAGKGLNRWVYIVIALNFLGVICQGAFKDENLWIFKKVGDALTFWPVVRTMTLYNGATTARARYPGRGTILSQLIVTAEYYSLLSHGADVVTKFLGIAGLQEVFFDEQLYDVIHVNNHYATYTRILCHGILLNILDETSSVQALGNNQQNGAAAGRHEDEHVDVHQRNSSLVIEEVALVSS